MIWRPVDVWVYDSLDMGHSAKARVLSGVQLSIQWFDKPFIGLRITCEMFEEGVKNHPGSGSAI